VESGSNRNRPELNKALAACRATGAPRVVAKLDRLARDELLILTIIESGTLVKFVDMPELDTDSPIGRFMVNQVSAVAALERRLISKRTKEALAAAKARGQVLGSPCIQKALQASIEAKQAMAKQFDAQVLPFIHKFQQAGHKTSRAIADQLTLAGVPTYRGGNRWGHAQVCEILRRAA
jgi:DNA invertase Pin-like site-specific DNA recombinase